jgi:hypothetical protein
MRLRRCELVWLLTLGCGRIAFDPLGGDSGVTVDGDPSRPNVAFITSGATVGALNGVGGIVGGDQICSDEAMQAGLPGTFIAWVSTTAVPITARLTGSRGWIRSDGEPLADTVEDLIAGKMFNPLDRLPDGSRVQGILEVWTGTGPTGLATNNCLDWTSSNNGTNGVFGLPTFSMPIFTNTAAFGICSSLQRLYCFEIGHAKQVVPNSVAARRAFVSAPVAIAGAFDQQCQDDANANALPGTYLAAVSLTTGSAASRFTTTAPWTRIDGTLLATTATGLFDGSLQTFVNQTADGTYLPSNSLATWSGSADPRVAGTMQSTCGNFTSATGNQATLGIPYSAASADLWGGTSGPCAGPYRLLCLQQ